MVGAIGLAGMVLIGRSVRLNRSVGLGRSFILRSRVSLGRSFGLVGRGLIVRWLWLQLPLSVTLHRFDNFVDLDHIALLL